MQEKINSNTYVLGLVSVVIPTYRRSQKLKRAVDSALNQTYNNIEVLVVNDNELGDEYTEEVKKVLSTINDARLQLMFQEKHINGAAARNVGIKAAKGEYIAFLDDDDYWDKDKIQIQVEALERLDNSFGGVSCLNRIFVDGKVKYAQIGYKDGSLCKKILMRRCEVSTITILLRRNALDETGYFDENLKRHQEVQLLSMFTTKYKLKLIKKYMCNVDSSSNENQPDPFVMEEIKRQFLESVKLAIDTLSCRDQKKVYIMNRFDIGMVMVKRKMIKAGAMRCAGIFKYPSTFLYAVEHIYRKIARIVFCSILIRTGKEYIEA